MRRSDQLQVWRMVNVTTDENSLTVSVVCKASVNETHATFFAVYCTIDSEMLVAQVLAGVVRLETYDALSLVFPDHLRCLASGNVYSNVYLSCVFEQGC